MSFKNSTKTTLIPIIALILCTACSSSDSSDNSDDNPQPIEQYYFKGLLDGEELLLQKNIYESPGLNDPAEHSIDHGGSLIYYEENPLEPETGTCETRFACGVSIFMILKRILINWMKPRCISQRFHYRNVH